MFKHLARAAVISAAASGMIFPAPAAGQQKRAARAVAAGGASELRVEQQDALGLLRRVADEAKSEPDQLKGALLQARAADVLWEHDEPLARKVFRSAFDAALKSESDGDAAARQEGAGKKAPPRRQAAVLKEVLNRLGAHDQKAAEELLALIESERAKGGQAAVAAAAANPRRAELLAQLALELTATDPGRAQQLGLLSLSGEVVPDAFGRLLFALHNRDKALSDSLLREAVAAMRRGRFEYSPALFSLSNYLFDQQGKRSAGAGAADARLLIAYFLDAAGAHAARWREARSAGGTALPESSALLYNFLATYAVPVVDQNAPDRQAQLHALLGELAAGLDQQQLRQSERLASDRWRKPGRASADDSDIDAYLRQAEKEERGEARDFMLRSAAVSLMRGDSRRALSVASRIDDPALRAQTEDDIYLVMLTATLRAGSHDEARQVALKVNEPGLKVRALVELASAALGKAKDIPRATELLTEAHGFALKGENDLTRLESFLAIAGQFAKFDQLRAFELLAEAVKAINQIGAAPDVAVSDVTARPAMRIVSMTVVNGKELTTGRAATLESIDFKQISPLVRHDYATAKGMLEKIDNKLMRSQLLIEAAASVLAHPEK